MHLDLRDPVPEALNLAYWAAHDAGAAEPVLAALDKMLWAHATPDP